MSLIESDRRTAGISFGPEYGSEDVGDSFGIGRTYTADEQAEADAIAINEKLNATALIGRFTGLLRCLYKGRLGRRLGDEGLSYLDITSSQVTVDGIGMLVGGACGVIHTLRGFRLIKFEAGVIRCVPLKLPAALDGMSDLYADQPFGVHSLAIATLALAFATVDEGINESTVVVPGLPTPYPNGWIFASSRPEAIGTTLELDPGVGFNATVHKLEFEVTVDEESGVESIAATLSEVESGVYNKSGAPVVWMPTPPPPYEMARLRHSGSDSNTSAVAVYAFYDSADVITPLYVQCVSNSGTSVFEEIENTTTSCCGACVATFAYHSQAGIKIVMGVSCGDYSDLSGGSQMTHAEINGTADQQSGGPEAGAAIVTAGSICYQSGSPISFIDLVTQIYAGPHTWEQTSLSGTDGGGDMAAVIPHVFVDGAFAVKVRSRQMDGNRDSADDTKGLSGGITNITGIEVRWTKTYGAFATLTGAGITNTHTSYPSEPRRSYAKYGEAHGVHADGSLQVVTVSEVNDDPGDPTMPTTWLDQFISYAGPIEFVAQLSQSWHGEGWMRLGPYVLSTAFGGIDPPLNDGALTEFILQPIGIQ